MSIQAVGDVLRYSKLKDRQRLIQIVLANYADTNLASWPSIKTICSESGCSERSIYRELAEMKKHPEVGIVKHGAKLYGRAKALGFKRNTLYFVLTHADKDSKIGTKLWSWQQSWTIHHFGENTANLASYNQEVIIDTSSAIQNAVSLLLNKNYTYDPTIYNREFEQSFKEIIKDDPLISYATSNILYSLNLLNRFPKPNPANAAP